MPSSKPIIDPSSSANSARGARPSSPFAGLASGRHRAAGGAPARLLPGAVGASALLLAAALAAQVPSGGPYSLPKQVIAGGGTRSSGGSYVLTDTAGQSAAGSASAGNYTLQQGFHSATSSGPLPDPLFRNGFE